MTFMIHFKKLLKLKFRLRMIIINIMKNNEKVRRFIYFVKLISKTTVYIVYMVFITKQNYEGSSKSFHTFKKCKNDK